MCIYIYISPLSTNHMLKTLFIAIILNPHFRVMSSKPATFPSIPAHTGGRSCRQVRSLTPQRGACESWRMNVNICSIYLHYLIPHQQCWRLVCASRGLPAQVPKKPGEPGSENRLGCPTERTISSASCDEGASTWETEITMDPIPVAVKWIFFGGRN